MLGYTCHHMNNISGSAKQRLGTHGVVNTVQHYAVRQSTREYRYVALSNTPRLITT